MTSTPSQPDAAARAPEAFRSALAELAQIGMSVARMVGQVAEAETAWAALVVRACAADGVRPIAESYPEAIEADRVAEAAAQARRTMVPRAETVAKVFRAVSRSVRLTVLLAERLDRGWARPGRERALADDRDAMARRQIARGVADAIAREADGERAERLSESLADRMETLDVEAALGNRPVEEIITEICRDIGLDAARMTVRSPLPGVAGMTGPEVATLLAGGGRGLDAGPGRGLDAGPGRGLHAGPGRRPPDG